MSVIQISTPFLRSLKHVDTAANLAISTILATPEIGIKRIIVVVQNKSAQNIEVIFSHTDTDGILVLPNQLISMDNYCGEVRVKSMNSDGALIHLAYAQV
jgi:hypothetical protein